MATAWLRSEASGVDPDTPLGYFGASTGAAAALLAAADADADVAAVVSRGGRPDLAGPRLPYVHCPTLLIVGGDDEPVLTLNRRARSRLTCPSRLVVVPGATHLFEERGALERVAGLARDWFLTHLTRPDPPAPTATEHAPFSWRAAAPAITGLPHGRGLNIAHEAVDRHLQLGRGGHVAVRSIGARRPRDRPDLRRPRRADLPVRGRPGRPRRRRRRARLQPDGTGPRPVRRRAGHAEARQRVLPAVLRVRARAGARAPAAGRRAGAGHHPDALPAPDRRGARLAAGAAARAPRRGGRRRPGRADARHPGPRERDGRRRTGLRDPADRPRGRWRCCTSPAAPPASPRRRCTCTRPCSRTT